VKFFEHIIPASNNRGQRSYAFWSVILPLIVTLAAVFLITRHLFPQYSKLFFLFLYSIPGQFIVAVIPHEPIIFYFSKYFSPLSVTLVTLLGTLFAEYLNYMLVKMFFKIPKIDDLRNHRTFKNATHYFLKLPFVSLVIAAITPVPFYPFRIIAPASEYPLTKYLLALIVGRTPRFYILAYFGYSISLPNEVIIVLFVLLFAVSVWYWFRRKGVDNRRRYSVKDSS
jgi:membrane protein YqaA with SNARE-associated domain